MTLKQSGLVYLGASGAQLALAIFMCWKTAIYIDVAQERIGPFVFAGTTVFMFANSALLMALAIAHTFGQLIAVSGSLKSATLSREMRNPIENVKIAWTLTGGRPQTILLFAVYRPWICPDSTFLKREPEPNPSFQRAAARPLN